MPSLPARLDAAQSELESLGLLIEEVRERESDLSARYASLKAEVTSIAAAMRAEEAQSASCCDPVEATSRQVAALYDLAAKYGKESP
jgi:septal ring factor EnvC (AmiA/AmiB activator)